LQITSTATMPAGMAATLARPFPRVSQPWCRYETRTYFINSKLSAMTSMPPTRPSTLSWPLP
jgi:hypothetical protein